MACIEMTVRSSRFRTLWRVMGGLGLLLCGLNVALLVAGDREWNDWIGTVLWG